MTAKQALEELKFQVGNITYFTKDLQATTHKVRDSGLFETIEKELKALEIVKEKVMPLVSLEDEDSICKPNQYRVYDSELYLSNELTKEEYDLLKEVLTDGK